MNKKNGELPLNIQLQGSDIPALLCALPIVTYIETGDPLSDGAVATRCEIIANKLMSIYDGGSVSLTFAESCMIADAVDTALEVVSGRWPELAQEIGADWKQELSGYFFSLNRLHPYYKELL